MQERLANYFDENGITIEKINYIEKELKLNLTSYRSLLNNGYNFTKKFEIIQ